MMTNSYKFPTPRLIGFDDLFKELEKFSLYKDNSYPRHNVCTVDDNEYLIELALAGYQREDITIEVENNTLTIKGTPTKEDDSKKYLHKGISSKSFTTSFKLNENAVVDKASFTDGILSISLRLEVPEEKRPQLIEIK